MKYDIHRASEALKSYEDILILTHALPDGDTLGCGYALCRALRALGKRATVQCSDEIPKKYSYLWEEMDEQEFEPKNIVAVDVADPKLLGKKLRVYENDIDLCIDHHISNLLYAKATLLDSDAGATAEIIFMVIKNMGVEIDKYTADCLYTGISTDTGCFKYNNTTSRTHRISAELIDLGADSAEINRIMLDTKSVAYLELQRLALESLELHFEGKCAIVSLSKDMFDKSGTNESDSEGIAALPRQIEGVYVGVTLRERAENQIRASVRTHKPINASEICKKLGGGGHFYAGGCKFKATLEESKAMILEVIEETLKEVNI